MTTTKASGYFNTPGTAHTIAATTTSSNVNLTATCRRIRLKAHTQDIYYTLSATGYTSDEHFLDNRVYEGIIIDVPEGTNVAVRTLTGNGNVYISELNW